MNEALDELGLNNTDELFEQLGLGERIAPLTARFLLGDEERRMAKRPHAASRIWSSPAPRAWSSATRSAAIRFRATTSWAT